MMARNAVIIFFIVVMCLKMVGALPCVIVYWCMRSEGRRATLEDVTSAMKFFLFLNEYGPFGRLRRAIIADSRFKV